jgi:molybdopterin/thiamine biosynthesis adenylyltransferase
MIQQKPKGRYTRHSEFTTNQAQQSLHDARILVAGCGAGSTILPHLARLGAGTNGCLILADPDTVDIENLNRQAYFEADLGVNKAEALARHVHMINSDVQVKIITEGITAQNVKSLIEGCTAAFDMIDIFVPAMSFALHDAAAAARIPIVTGVDFGEEVVTYVFDYSDPSACTLRQFFGIPDSMPLSEIEHLPGLGLFIQFFLGSTGQIFASTEQAMEYYSTIYQREYQNIAAIMTPQVADVLGRLVSGHLSYVPQTDSAVALFGLMLAVIMREVIAGNPVNKAPIPMRGNVLRSIAPH